MNDPTLPLSGLSSVRGKSVIARFDGGMLSSNGGVLALAEVERRLRIAERLARCIVDPRDPGQVVHSLADMIGFRMKMIAAGRAKGEQPPSGAAALGPCDKTVDRRLEDVQTGPRGRDGPRSGR